MSAVIAPVLLAYGVHLLYTALALGWSGLRPGPSGPKALRDTSRAETWLAQAGLAEVRPGEFVTVVAVVALLGATSAFALFGGLLPAVAVGGFAATFPVASYRRRRRDRRAKAQEAWPRMIEELRLLTGTLGQSVPQALFEVGERAPEQMRPAFEGARREWLMSTDFERTIDLLKDRLGDPTADAACETLLVAHDLGGTDLDGRLEALALDRIQDLQGRKDARSKQAGVRFARRFVLIVPLGMAGAGMSVGNGRASYASTFGQLAVAAGVATVVACWAWAGAILRIPEEARVFS